METIAKKKLIYLLFHLWRYQMATESIMKYLDKGNISDLSKTTDHLEDAKEAALLIASNRGTLLVRAGYTQEEISEKINSEMAELEEQISNGGSS